MSAIGHMNSWSKKSGGTLGGTLKGTLEGSLADTLESGLEGTLEDRPKGPLRGYLHPIALCFSVDDGGGGSIERAFASENDISLSPAAAGMRLGGRICDGLVVCTKIARRQQRSLARSSPDVQPDNVEFPDSVGWLSRDSQKAPVVLNKESSIQ
ncbi:hypothetical protein ANO11243_038790 [Dothideomycetidae sp. 11243]|nr:hypothetical protein ANO11243_038790 [fungal sp. No.11243]